MSGLASGREAFSTGFRADLLDLMRWRRDVRRFRTDHVDEAVLMRCLDTFSLAPSVGLSEPWRLVRVDSADARDAALENFRAENARALDGYDGDKARIYSTLKLSGMQEAPVQLAIFCDEATAKGAGLGAATMPETRRYSVVGAVTQFWLAARAEGLGVGWVSILDPERLTRDLDVPADWRLVAYLCVGWPETVSDTPELVNAGWENRCAALPIQSR
ncbi:5,6-dimethylbenzimidazole synthase [Aliiroseovarius sp.]|uniref:5,6-dimethylbenzimidazole synthase n=1 Tax=Aliiroseovarius sp. TaxID=1872442 RepID=UPI00260B438E|nr:5,6-dimethylbenzimidazole synthase [Aliiroseovarius sp.]